jgi:hypothetical protein
MAYLPGIKARGEGVSDQIISGSGRLPKGAHEVELSSISYIQNEGSLLLTFTELSTGDTHREKWWLWNSFKNIEAYSTEWRNWLAVVIPDLEAAKLYEQTRNIAGFVGTKLFIEVDHKEDGYTLQREGDLWMAVWHPDNTPVSDWATLEETRKAVKNLQRSYLHIVGIEAKHHRISNVRNYVQTVKKTIVEPTTTETNSVRRHSS